MKVRKRTATVVILVAVLTAWAGVWYLGERPYIATAFVVVSILIECLGGLVVIIWAEGIADEGRDEE